MQERMSESQVAAMQDRFVSDIEDIVRESECDARPRKRIVMLSGGIDSLFLLAVLRKVLPHEILHTIHVRGPDGGESHDAKAAADRFATVHEEFEVTLEAVLDNLHRIKGKGYTELSRLISHICYELCFECQDVKDCHIYHGNGADLLYGNTTHVGSIAESLIESGECEDLNAATIEAKRIEYSKDIGDKRYFVKLAEQFGARAIMPYTDRRLTYLSDVPSSVISPLDKRFVKDALRRCYGLGDIVERRRMSMQAGIGFRNHLKAALRDRFSCRGGSVNVVVRKLSA